jgi:hypothetical protein
VQARDLLKGDPEIARALANLAEAQSRSGHLEEAADGLKRTLTIFEDA